MLPFDDDMAATETGGLEMEQNNDDEDSAMALLDEAPSAPYPHALDNRQRAHADVHYQLMAYVFVALVLASAAVHRYTLGALAHFTSSTTVYTL